MMWLSKKWSGKRVRQSSGVSVGVSWKEHVHNEERERLGSKSVLGSGERMYKG